MSLPSLRCTGQQLIPTKWLTPRLIPCLPAADTACSPAPHLAAAKLATWRSQLTDSTGLPAGGGAIPRALAAGRPPLPLPLRQPLGPSSAANSQHGGLSLGSADGHLGGSIDTSCSHRNKRPRRAASGGVLGAIAAEAAGWGVDTALSPPLRRSTSLPVARLDVAQQGGGAAVGRKQVVERVTLLKRALAGGSAANAQPVASAAGPGKACGMEEEDAVSALFSLSSSMC